MKNINVVNIDGSAAVSHTGEAISGSQLFAASAQAVVTGTSTGTLKFQFSNDVLPLANGVNVPTNWSDLSGVSVAIAGSGVYAIPKFDVCYANIRTVFTFGNAAVGTILVTVCRGGA